jgi:hypothetical protein
LTGGAAAGLRVIELLPDQHHLSNVMSLIASSLNTQTHSPTVEAVKRLERETVYFLSDQRTHVVPIKVIYYMRRNQQEKAAWSNESQEIGYLEWNPDEEAECWDKIMLVR